MAGVMFMISLISILTAVGFIFAWMVRLASMPQKSQNHGIDLKNISKE